MSQVASQENGHVSHVVVQENDLVRLLTCSSFFFPVGIVFVEVTKDKISDGIHFEWMTFLFGMSFPLTFRLYKIVMNMDLETHH